MRHTALRVGALTIGSFQGRLFFCNMKGDIWFYYKTPLEGDIVSVSGTLCSMKGIECLDRMQGLFIQVGILQMMGNQETA